MHQKPLQRANKCANLILKTTSEFTHTAAFFHHIRSNILINRQKCVFIVIICLIQFITDRIGDKISNGRLRKWRQIYRGYSTQDYACFTRSHLCGFCHQTVSFSTGPMAVCMPYRWKSNSVNTWLRDNSNWLQPTTSRAVQKQEIFNAKTEHNANQWADQLTNYTDNVPLVATLR